MRHHHKHHDQARHYQDHFDRHDHFHIDGGQHHFSHHAMGRHHGDHSGGFGGPGGFGGFGDGDGFTRGRKVNAQDLQLLLLALLAEKPAHGYELIKALEVRSNGFYTPSPGMVYPALTYLEELGQLTVTLEGNRKSYALAEPGREYLAANRERADMMLAKLAHIARKMDSMRRAYSGEFVEPGSDTGESGGAWLPELNEARHALKSALFQRSAASPDEQRKIAEILKHATQAILGT